MAESRVQISAVQEPRLLCHGRTQGWNGRIQGAHECRARSQSTTAVIASRCCVMLFGSLAIESISARRKAWSLRAVSKVARLRSFVCDCSTSAPAVLSVSGRVHGQNPAVLQTSVGKRAPYSWTVLCWMDLNRNLQDICQHLPKEAVVCQAPSSNVRIHRHAVVLDQFYDPSASHRSAFSVVTSSVV
jgi:hypothetical protein